MRTVIPTLLSISGLHLGQLLTLKNAAAIARMTRKSLLLPFRKVSDYPLVETIKKTLTENECHNTEILDVENESYFIKEIRKLAELSFKKYGETMILTPLQEGDIEVNLIFGRQFESDLRYSLETAQKLNIVNKKKQTPFEIEDGLYVTQEFIDIALPCIFDEIDTFVLGGNIIGAWPTKALKLINSKGKLQDHYNIFIHPILILDREKIGIWRKGIDTTDLLNAATLDKTNWPLFFNVLTLYYTTKAKGKEIKITDSDIKEVMKICNKIINISHWINNTFPYHFTTPFTEGSRKLNLNNMVFYDFNKVKAIVLATSRAIDLFKKTNLHNLYEIISEFGLVCAVLDYTIFPRKTKLYDTGSEMVCPSAASTIFTDRDMILIPGIENNANLFIKPIQEKKVDLKIFTKEDFGYGLNMKFVSMLLDSNLDNLTKEQLYKKLSRLAPEFSRAYLIEGLFEGYLFEKILQEEIKSIDKTKVLPTDLIKKAIGLQRTIDYLRWYSIIAHSKNLFDENEVLSFYKLFLEQRRQLANKMFKAEFFEILCKRTMVLECLHEATRDFETSEIKNYLLLLSKIIDTELTKKEFIAFIKVINFYFRLDDLDDTTAKIFAIKFSENVERSIQMFHKLKYSKPPKTQFLEKEGLKALLQRLRLENLFAKNDQIYTTLSDEIIDCLYDIDPIYTRAALKKVLPETTENNLLFFYWNNLTHISDLYKKGLPCR